MAEFVYNNTKYASMRYMRFELNCEYHPCVFYEEDINPCSKSKAANRLIEKLKNLISPCRENL